MMRWVVIVAVLTTPLLAATRSQVYQEAVKKDARVQPAADRVARSEGGGRKSNDTRKGAEKPLWGGEGRLTNSSRDVGPSNVSQTGPRQATGSKSSKFNAYMTTERNPHEETEYQYTIGYSVVTPPYTNNDSNNGHIFYGKGAYKGLEGFVHRIPSNPLMLGENIIKEGRLCNGTVLPRKEWCNECLCLRGMWLCTNKWCDDRSEWTGADHGVSPARRPTDLLDILPRHNPQPLYPLPATSFQPTPKPFPYIQFPSPVTQTVLPLSQVLHIPEFNDEFDDIQSSNYF